MVWGRYALPGRGKQKKSSSTNSSRTTASAVVPPWFAQPRAGPALEGANTPRRDDGPNGPRPLGAQLRDHLPRDLPRPVPPKGALCGVSSRILFSSSSLGLFDCFLYVTPKADRCQGLFPRKIPGQGRRLTGRFQQGRSGENRPIIRSAWRTAGWPQARR